MSKALKVGIVLLVVLCLLLLAVVIFDLPVLGMSLDESAQSNESVEATGTPEAGDKELTEAVAKALDNASDEWQQQNYQIDHIQIQDDGKMAMVWLAATDPETGEFLGREPELALAELGDDDAWHVLLNGEENFDVTLSNYQYSDKCIEGDLDIEGMPKSGKVYGGYYLPWAEGLTKRLTWSVAHTSCYPIYYCTHAFDFADGTMFPIVASKGGTVYHWKDTCANGDSSCTNSITIQDRSTTPWTYQIYMHIAQGSIPANLKHVGTTVLQGQYIADVDDTGYSTGHHLHFMVVSQDTMYMSTKGYVFGMAEDITFRDVTINWDEATQGGRPRLAYEAESYGGEGTTYYTSGNSPANPPTGGITAPLDKKMVTSSSLTVTGWAEDDVSVTKIEILANYNDAWVQIGEQQGGTSFSITLDLCDAGIPDGPFELGLRVWDYEGNPSSILTVRELVKDVECGESGADPTVTLVRKSGKLVLQNGGLVSANTVDGSTGSEVTSVEFWFHGTDWNGDKWVNLGLDADGSNGWQAVVNVPGLTEGSNYTIVAVATDADGNQDAYAVFKAIVDKTAPEIVIDPVVSPVTEGTVTLHWASSDALTSIDHYVLSVDINSSGYQVIESNLSGSVDSYQYDVNDEQLFTFKLEAYDLGGNQKTVRTSLYTTGYEFPNMYMFPLFVGDD
jgi:hypothetical protein